MGVSDRITDGIASKISKTKVTTTVVTLDQILSYLETVLKEVGPEEAAEIEKVLKGSFWSSLKIYDTKDEKYRISTLYAGTIGSSRLVNEVSVMENESGNIYTYKSFLFKGKFKKAARQLAAKYTR